MHQTMARRLLGDVDCTRPIGIVRVYVCITCFGMSTLVLACVMVLVVLSCHLWPISGEPF